MWCLWHPGTNQCLLLWGWIEAIERWKKKKTTWRGTKTDPIKAERERTDDQIIVRQRKTIKIKGTRI